VSQSASEGDIRALEDRRFAAMAAADVAALDELLGEDLIYTHSSSSLDTKASLIEGIRTKRFSYQKFEREQERIRVYGDSAVVAGQVRISLGGSAPRVLSLRYLDVWARGAGGWQMVAWQSTVIPS
jgi:ketosteroid isomerase-like protein